MRERKERKERKPHRVRRLLILLAIVAAAACGLKLAWDELTDLNRLNVVFYELADDKIEGNVRIAFLSDLHLNEIGESNETLVAQVRKLSPDLIAIGGDMTMMNDPDTRVVLELVEQLVPIAPVYYAMGNHEFHDYLVNGSSLPSEVEALGATFLSDECVTVEVNGNLMDIGGLSEMSNHFETYGVKFFDEYTQSENYRLLLVHDPAYFVSGGPLVGEGIDLALCGHWHGGQVVVPYLGGLYSPGVGLFTGMSEGSHDISGTWVVISRGLGNSSRFPRINNPPELVIVDLY